MSYTLKLLMVGYFGGVLIFAACVALMLTNGLGLTWIPVPGWAFFGGFGLMIGSKLIAQRVLREGEANHG